MDNKTVFNVTVCLIGAIVLLLHVIQFAMKKQRRKDENALLLFYGFTAFHFALYATFAFLKRTFAYDAFIMAFYTIFFICNNLEAFLFYNYFSHYSSIPPRTRKIAGWINIVSFAAFTVSDIVNIFTRMYFTSVNGVYTRNPFMFFAQGYQFIVLGMALLLALASHKLLIREKVAFSIYALLPLISIIVQNLMPGYAIAYATLFVAVEILTFFLIQEKNIRLKEEEKQLEQAKTQVLMSQIRPHFVYNTLSSISTLISIDPSKAQVALDDFSEYLRVNFSTLTKDHPIPFEDELEHIRTYVSLEKMRFEERLSVSYDIKAKDFFVPPLSVQPLVENAIKHGVLKKEEGGHVCVASYEESDAYVVTISDDGVGFNSSMVDSEAVGLENVKKRLELTHSGVLSIKSEIGKGTVITVRFFKGAL